jgi:hypothetical protein
LPNLSVVAEDPDTDWTPMTLAHWYGEGERTVEVVSETALWYSTGLPAVPLRWVLIRDPKEEFETQALLCTDLDADPERGSRADHLVVRKTLANGGHFPRSASAPRLRDTAALVGACRPAKRAGPFGPVLDGHPLRPSVHGPQERKRRSTSGLWYEKQRPTFSDALALVRKELWAWEATFCGSYAETDTVKVPRALVERLNDAVCYAA